MAWRGPRTANDPLLATREWRTTIRQHWIRLRLPCWRCKKMIDYDGPRYLIDSRGRRRLNPKYLVVGHLIDRYTAKWFGWTEAQTNALSNTAPECASCSAKSGARLGQKVQRANRARRQQLTTSRRW